MISSLIAALMTKISVFKGLNFLGKGLVEFIKLMNSDFGQIVKTLNALSVEISHPAKEDEVFTIGRVFKEYHTFRQENEPKDWSSYFYYDEESKKLRYLVEEFAKSIFSMGIVIQTINHYCAEKKSDLKGALSDSLNLNYLERKSLQKDDEANISSRLGIEGMTLILVVACQRASLIFKYNGTTQEIGLERKEIDEDCKYSNLMSITGADDVVEALATCPHFISVFVDHVLTFTGEDLKKLEGPLLGGDQSKGQRDSRGS